MESVPVDAHEGVRRLVHDAYGKVAFALWVLMVLAALIMSAIAVSIGRTNNSKLAAATVRLDEAFEFDFDAFATTACRTCEGTTLIVHDDTPIAVSPYVGGSRQFPSGIKTPCFSSTSRETFETRADTSIDGGTDGLTTDADTLLANPQGLHLSDVGQDCMGAAPCLPSSTFCETEFGSMKPYGPIYRLTRTNVGSGADTLIHLCVCILDYDPIGDAMVPLPYCTEPFA
jgi:hypothetical protein